MKKIENRDDINLLVRTFYSSIRKDMLLGPIFNAHITEDKWPEHLEKLTDFWVSTLLGAVCFKGSPTKAHRKVDKNVSHSISQYHFDRWVALWHKTIDSLFNEELAERAKQASKLMAMEQLNAIKSFRNYEH